MENNELTNEILIESKDNESDSEKQIQRALLQLIVNGAILRLTSKSNQ